MAIFSLYSGVSGKWTDADDKLVHAIKENIKAQQDLMTANLKINTKKQDLINIIRNDEKYLLEKLKQRAKIENTEYNEQAIKEKTINELLQLGFSQDYIKKYCYILDD